MAFLIIVLSIWLLYTFIMKKRKREKFRFYKAILPLLLFSIIITIDLGINYVASAVPSLNDGIGIHTAWAYWIIGEDGWSVSAFKSYFDKAGMVSTALLIVYSVLKIVEE